jgi:predicted metalloprotease with PDZ domain
MLDGGAGVYVRSKHFLFILCFLLSCCASDLFAQAVRLEVDATEATGRIFHSAMTFPVKPGPVTLVYPKWFPGTHAPTGQIADMVGLKMKAAGREISWSRDPFDMFAFHCTVPKGADQLEVRFDFVVPSDRQADHHPSAAGQYAAMISWTSLLLYPQGSVVESLMYKPELRLPEGWKYGTALKTQTQSQNTIGFDPVSLYTLIDSPVVAGEYFRSIDLSSGSDVPHLMDLAADSEAALQMKPEILAGFQKLIHETLSLFGARHYRKYLFLVTLSDPISGGAVEHHESSDNRPPERMFLDEEPYLYWADTLPHEMAHSWIGKYRRPSGLDTRDYQQAIHSDLLWVYEGLTNYVGFVLAARSGLLPSDRFNEAMAWIAAGQDQRPGRSWKPLLDTTVGAQAIIDSSSEWDMWRRRLDYYNEGTLLWLEVDTLLRQKSGGRASLDDFCRSFFGGTSGPPEVKPFTLDEMLSALNGIVPYDWKQFFASRVDEVSAHAPLAGLEQSGWRLAYGKTATVYHAAAQKEEKRIDLRYSTGLVLNQEGNIVDVLPGSSTAKAGLAPGMKVLGVNGRHWSRTRIEEAIGASSSVQTPLEFLVENGDFYSVVEVDYHGGAKYPILEREQDKPDLLNQIIAPRSNAK